jgi:hypothetical protein
VVFTGTDTKQIMNFGGYKQKLPRFERLLNLIMLVNLIFMLVLSTSLTLANRYWNHKYMSQYLYLEGNGSESLRTLLVFFSFWIMCNSVMALNIEVALQIQKIIYTFWI